MNMKRRYQVRKSKVDFEFFPSCKWIVKFSSTTIGDQWFYHSRFESVQEAWIAIARLEGKDVRRD